MPNKDLRLRTREYARRIIKLYTSLPKSTVAQVIGKQILRSGTSVGAQYAESFRAKSRADFTNKALGSLQELEETGYWMQLLIDENIITTKKLEPLLAETEELISIFVTMIKRTRETS